MSVQSSRHIDVNVVCFRCNVVLIGLFGKRRSRSVSIDNVKLQLYWLFILFVLRCNVVLSLMRIHSLSRNL